MTQALVPSEGSLSAFSLAELLAGYAQAKQSGRLVIHTPLGQAEVRLFDGSVVEARFGPAQGETALLRLMSIREGHFSLESQAVPAGAVTSGELADILLKAHSHQAEVEKQAEQLGGLAECLHLDMTLLARRMQDVPPEIGPILRLIDGKRTIRDVLALTELPDVTVLRVLRKLRGMGLLRTTVEQEKEAAELAAKAALKESRLPPEPPRPLSLEEILLQQAAQRAEERAALLALAVPPEFRSPVQSAQEVLDAFLGPPGSSLAPTPATPESAVSGSSDLQPGQAVGKEEQTSSRPRESLPPPISRPPSLEAIKAAAAASQSAQGGSALAAAFAASSIPVEVPPAGPSSVASHADGTPSLLPPVGPDAPPPVPAGEAAVSVPPPALPKDARAQEMRLPPSGKPGPGAADPVVVRWTEGPGRSFEDEEPTDPGAMGGWDGANLVTPISTPHLGTLAGLHRPGGEDPADSAFFAKGNTGALGDLADALDDAENRGRSGRTFSPVTMGVVAVGAAMVLVLWFNRPQPPLMPLDVTPSVRTDASEPSQPDSQAGEPSPSSEQPDQVTSPPDVSPSPLPLSTPGSRSAVASSMAVTSAPAVRSPVSTASSAARAASSLALSRPSAETQPSSRMPTEPQPDGGVSEADRQQRARAQVDVLYDKGIKLVNQERYQEARQTFEGALKIDPSDARIHTAMGRVEYELGQLDVALALLKKSEALNREYAPTYLVMGLVHQERGDLDAAEKAYRRFLSLESTGPDAKAVQGFLNQMENQRNAKKP